MPNALASNHERGENLTLGSRVSNGRIDPNGTFDQDYHVADLSLSRVTQIVLSYRRQRGAMTRTRKIVAIFAADVVGFSRMTGADEDGALSRLRALRAETHP